MVKQQDLPPQNPKEKKFGLRKTLALAGASSLALALTGCGSNAQEQTAETRPTATASASPFAGEEASPSTSATPEVSQDAGEEDPWKIDLEIDPTLPEVYKNLLETRYDPETSWGDYLDTFVIPDIEGATETQIADMLTRAWRDYTLSLRPGGIQEINLPMEHQDDDEIEDMLIAQQREILEVLISNDLSPAEKQLRVNLGAKKDWNLNRQQAAAEAMVNAIEYDTGFSGKSIAVENPYRCNVVISDVSPTLAGDTLYIGYVLNQTANFEEARSIIAQVDSNYAHLYSDYNSMKVSDDQVMEAHLDADNTWRFMGVRPADKEVAAN